MRELAAEGGAKLGPGYATTWLQRGGDDITSVMMTHEFGHRVYYVQRERIKTWKTVESVLGLCRPTL